MNILSNYDRDELNISGELEEHNPKVRDALTKFIRGNHQKYTLYQMAVMLNVTPSFIQSVLTPEQLRRTGRRPAASTLIIRDYNKWEQDKEDFNDYPLC